MAPRGWGASHTGVGHKWHLSSTPRLAIMRPFGAFTREEDIKHRGLKKEWVKKGVSSIRKDYRLHNLFNSGRTG